MADKIVQLTDKDGNNIFPTVGQNVPNMTLTDVDPGEGAALAAGDYVAVYGVASSLVDIFYPVGCYFETSDMSFNPNTAWGGTWVEDTAGRVTVAVASSGPLAVLGSTGGEEKHQLTESELPTISGSWTIHAQESGTEFYVLNGHATGELKSGKYKTFGSSYTSGANSYSNPGFKFGGDSSHNNLQPYIVVKRWHRTA